MNMNDVVHLEPTFASTHAALAFAFNFSSEQYAPSIIGRLLMGQPIGSGSGLSGLDGAAQAGMVLAEVTHLGHQPDGTEDRQLSAMRAHLLAARYAQRLMPCACRQLCCRGTKPAPAWEVAVRWLAEHAIEAVPSAPKQYVLRHGLVRRFFGDREATFVELARLAKVNRDTAAEHNNTLSAWLKREENAAFHAAEYALGVVHLVRTQVQEMSAM